MLSCQDLVIKADSYLANELTPWQQAQFRLHLAVCRNCRRYLKTLRLTQEVSKQIPLPIREFDVEAIVKRIQQDC
ncbi:zf-HC2 domain-containing protein [Agitococcus lubricus]|uniref:Putative zinc finger protein n=1 Tax=Agitococcus lubricus TaxID=1077255 RepID=A0A2T5J3I4_9GAMM|nr:zf-HC2 domain-containing protein [Agitococcus lubricus]PTQ91152.1 putative zinc finger protein [Agitococcus lubricus]